MGTSIFVGFKYINMPPISNLVMRSCRPVQLPAWVFRYGPTVDFTVRPEALEGRALAEFPLD